MEIVHRRGAVTVGDVEAELPGQPANSTVRTLMSILERKGHLRVVNTEGGKKTFAAAEDKNDARVSALEKLTSTFFGGSITSVVATLLDARRDKLSPEELDEIETLIQKAKEEGR